MIFVKYFLDRSKKADLPTAVVFVAMTALGSLAWGLFLQIYYQVAILSAIIGYAIAAVISFVLCSYTYGVCKRYAA